MRTGPGGGRNQRAGSPRRKLLLVVNPIASSVTVRARGLLAAALSSRYEVVSRVTEAQGHARSLARDAANEGVDAVVSFGGDGTANEIANGLAGSEVPLTCLPGGSANVFCGVAGIPRDLVGAARHLLRRADSWSVREVDAATVNGRRFLFTSGVGLDAAVVSGVDARPDLKRRWRQWWFVTEAGRKIAGDYRFDPPAARLDSQSGEDLTGIAIVVQNGRPWTYFGSRPVTVSSSAGLETGTLTATVVPKPLPWDYPSIAWRVLSGRGTDDHSRIETVERSSFSIVPEDGETIEVHVDGDHIGSIERADYSIEPGGMRVLA